MQDPAAAGGHNSTGMQLRMRMECVNPVDNNVFRGAVWRNCRRIWMGGWMSTIGHACTRGKCCYGKTPMQTFLDSLSLAREKMLDAQLRPAPVPEGSPTQRRRRRGRGCGRLQLNRVSDQV